MIYKFKNGGTVKLQGAWSKIPKIINKTIKNIRGADGKIFHSQIVRNPNNYYRSVDKEAILDAKSSGLIRGHYPESDFPGSPYFARSHEPFNWRKYVIEGTPESARWIGASKYNNGKIIDVTEKPLYDYSKGYYSADPEMSPKDYSDFINDYEVFPLTNGSINSSPASNFRYWQKHPLIGWRLHEF